MAVRPMAARRAEGMNHLSRRSFRIRSSESKSEFGGRPCRGMVEQSGGGAGGRRGSSSTAAVASGWSDGCVAEAAASARGAGSIRRAETGPSAPSFSKRRLGASTGSADCFFGTSDTARSTADISAFLAPSMVPRFVYTTSIQAQHQPSGASITGKALQRVRRHRHCGSVAAPRLPRSLKSQHHWSHRFS